jgi:hypothetical protein
MKTTFLFKWLSLFTILILLAGGAFPGGVQRAAADDLGPAPWLAAFPENEAVEAWEWPDGASVHLAIDDPATPASPDLERDGVMAVTPWGDPRTYVRFDFAGAYDLKVGDVVSITDGVTPRQHTVLELDISGVDAVADTVAGTAYIGATVQVWPHGHDQYATLYVTATDGTWLADFSGLFNLVAGTGGRSQIVDLSGSATVVDWNAPNPRFNVRVNEDKVEAWEWPLGETLTLQVGGQEFTGVVGQTPWDPNSTLLEFYLAGQHDIQSGEMVRLANRDNTIVKETMVTGLEFAGFDLDADLMYGKAEAFSRVDVWACNPNEPCINRHVDADELGNWTADFSQPGDEPDEWITIDLHSGTWVDSQQVDADSDATMYGSTLPDINAFPVNEAVESWNWAMGATVHLAIDDPATPESPDFERDGVMAPTPWGDPRPFVRFDFAGEYDLKAGDVVSITDGVSHIEHTVLELAVTNIDFPQDTVSGTAFVGAFVQVWPHETGQQVNVTASDGTWQVDFTGIFDLGPGDGGRAQIVDAGGNITVVDWNAPNIRFDVRPNFDQVEAWEWTLGDWLTLEIDGSVFGPQEVIPAPWDPNQTYASFNLTGVYNIQPGQSVILRNSAGTMIKTTTVSLLAFTDMNAALDTVSGTAEPGSRVDVWACIYNGCFNRHVYADATGAWIADFAHPGVEGDEQDIVDLTGGTWVDSRVGDEDNDSTMYGANSPVIEAHPQYEFVNTSGWPYGEVTLTIAGGSEPYTATTYIPRNPADPYNTWVDFPLNGFDLQPGQTLTVSGGGLTRTYIVTDPLVTQFDLVNDTVSGIAVPGNAVQVCVNMPDYCINRWTTADATGNWTVSFAATSDPRDHPELYDLVQGSTGWMSEENADGNQTWALDWRAQESIPGWEQVNRDGFGSASTTIAVLEVFRNQLYVGAANWNFGARIWRTTDGSLWEPVAMLGEGNKAILDMIGFAGNLYAGTGWSEKPAEIWRSKDGVTWIPVTTDGFGLMDSNGADAFVIYSDMLYVAISDETEDGGVSILRSSTGDAGSWMPVVTNGNGDPDNFLITGFALFKDSLYAIGKNRTTGAFVWKASPDGASWTQVNPPGFGDAFQAEAISIAAFKGNLYVGTCGSYPCSAENGQIWKSSNGVDWLPVVTNGFGNGSNRDVTALYEYQGALYAVVSNIETGNQVWMTRDGTSWQQENPDGWGDPNNTWTLRGHGITAYKSSLYIASANFASGVEIWRLNALGKLPRQTWVQINQNGFGDGNNNEITRMTIHKNMLYISTDNNVTGGEMWRSADGYSWTQVNRDGFGNPDNDRLQVEGSINGYLYVGTGETPGASADLWRCAICNGSDWTLITNNGFGDPNNHLIQRVLYHNGRIFATMDNVVTGAEIWSSATGAPGSWTQVNQDGFGDSQNTGVWAASIFNGYFYVMTAQWGPPTDTGTYTGLEVWRCTVCNGSDWEQVSLDGFGDRDNFANAAYAFNGFLYVSTYHMSFNQGGQIWRCQVCDGSDWVQVVAGGFGNGNNFGGGFMIEFNAVLYAITESSFGGLEVWKTSDGVTWKMEGLPGFGNANNDKSWAGVVFKKSLFLGTRNFAEGCELWKRMP